MSTAPLNRDEQIKLMETASDRLDSFVQKWKDSDVVSEMLCEPHPDLSGDNDYARSGEKISCYG
jgi:hypothetical protein